MNLAPVYIGQDRIEKWKPVHLGWRNRAIRVTGAIESGKTLFIRRLLDYLPQRAEVIGYAGSVRDQAVYPEFFHFGELDGFHDAVTAQVAQRWDGDTERPLVIVADKWAGTKGVPLDDIRRIARHGERLNAYVFFEDRNRAAGPFRQGFGDIKPTTVTMTRGEGLVAYDRGSDLLRFSHLPAPPDVTRSSGVRV